MSKYVVIAQLQEENQRLHAEVAALWQEREQNYTYLLSRIATVAHMLQKAPDYTTVIANVVQLLGEAVGSSRCYITQSQFDIESKKSLLVFPYEWSSSNISKWQEATSVIFWEDFGDCWTFLSRGQVLNFLVENQLESAKSILKAQGTTSMLYLPIIIKNEYWGAICFDSCGKVRLFNQEEIAILKVAANCIAGAIERKEYTTEELLQAEQSAVLKERNRMAHEIHDTLAQSFTGISMQVKAAKLLATTQPEAAWRLIDNVNELAKAGLAEARRSVWSLHSDAAEYQEFVAALRRSLTEMTVNTSINTTLEVKGTPYPLAYDTGRNLLRVVQEAVTNSLRHAESTSITVEVFFNPKSLKIHIQDNGRGFETTPNLDQGGFGLSCMQQRCTRMGGTFEVHSKPAEGTTVVIEAPVLATDDKPM
ncbi:hypothetical protein NIES2101_29770 [Calothrix sp. HK-06]|nr:hypothetical protein NIES2101_29770 [Calothrix sp. HK-06]